MLQAYRGRRRPAVAARGPRGDRAEPGARCSGCAPLAARGAHARRPARAARGQHADRQAGGALRAARRRFQEGARPGERAAAAEARRAALAEARPSTNGPGTARRAPYSDETPSGRTRFVREARGLRPGSPGISAQRRPLRARRASTRSTSSRSTVTSASSTSCTRRCAPRARRRSCRSSVDLADPSPGRGWRGVERRPLRGRGAAGPRPSASRSCTTWRSRATCRSPSSSTGSRRPAARSWSSSPTRDDPMVTGCSRPSATGCTSRLRPREFERALAARFDVERTRAARLRDAHAVPGQPALVTARSPAVAAPACTCSCSRRSQSPQPLFDLLGNTREFFAVARLDSVGRCRLRARAPRAAGGPARARVDRRAAPLGGARVPRRGVGRADRAAGDPRGGRTGSAARGRGGSRGRRCRLASTCARAGRGSSSRCWRRPRCSFSCSSSSTPTSRG